jgi:flagellar biosynthetic protein FliP
MNGAFALADRRAVVALGLCAVALAAGGTWGLAAAGTLGAVAWIARRSRPAAGAAGASALERVGTLALGPGAALHAVRFGDRILLVGVTSSGITLVDAVEPVDAPPPRAPSRGAALALAALAALALPFVPGRAEATQSGESGTQRVDFGARRDDTPTPPRGPLAALPVPAPEPLALPADLVERHDQPVGGTLVGLALLSLLPFAVMGMSSFVKISVVLSLLRTALSTPQTPSDPVLATIALSLTVFVMGPVGSEAYTRFQASGANPNSAAGMLAAASAASEPLRAFLTRNTRPEEVALFVEIATRDGGAPPDPAAFAILLPAFLTTELREAFVAGFLLFIPFLVLDMVVANILMSMGMVMVSPATVSLPLKIMLFVLVDGWPLLMKGLALGYQ